MTDYATIALMARQKAVYAMHQGNPESARKWVEVAAAADRAARPCDDYVEREIPDYPKQA